MKICLAGTSVSNPAKEPGLVELFKEGHKLHSYYHLQPRGLETVWWNMSKKLKMDLILDSGAFTAFTQEVDINIQEYIEFIREHKDILTVYANLDVIGDARGTWKNQRIMERAGLSPLPCFHMGEDWDYLERYVDRYDYIAIGGVAQARNRSQLISFLDKCFGVICDGGGMPRCRTHGFAVTSVELLWRYPWYSVDSTSWVVSSRMGQIFVPLATNGQYDFRKDAMSIPVSSRAPSKKDHGKHFDTLAPAVRSYILDYTTGLGYVMGKSSFHKEPAGTDLPDNMRWAEKKGPTERLVEVIEEPGLCNTYQLRDEINILYFQYLENAFPEYPQPWVRPRWEGFGL